MFIIWCLINLAIFSGAPTWLLLHKKNCPEALSNLRGNFKVFFRACPTIGGGLGVILFFPQMIHIFQYFSSIVEITPAGYILIIQIKRDIDYLKKNISPKGKNSIPVHSGFPVSFFPGIHRCRPSVHEFFYCLFHILW